MAASLRDTQTATGARRSSRPGTRRRRARGGDSSRAGSGPCGPPVRPPWRSRRRPCDARAGCARGRPSSTSRSRRRRDRARPGGVELARQRGARRSGAPKVTSCSRSVSGRPDAPGKTRGSPVEVVIATPDFVGSAPGPDSSWALAAVRGARGARAPFDPTRTRRSLHVTPERGGEDRDGAGGARRRDRCRNGRRCRSRNRARSRRPRRPAS